MALTLVRFGDDKKPLAPLPEKSQKRLAHLRPGGYLNKGFFPLAVVEDERGRGAVAYTKTDHGGQTATEVAFYEGGSIKRPLLRKDFSASMHGALDLVARFEEHMGDVKALKQAPHPFKVGDVLVSVYGYSMTRATFYQIVEVPTPRKVALVTLRQYYSSGDHHSGSVMPVLPPEGGLAEGPRRVHMVSMAKGYPRVVGMDSTSSVNLWNGKPVHTNSD